MQRYCWFFVDKVFCCSSTSHTQKAANVQHTSSTWENPLQKIYFVRNINHKRMVVEIVCDNCSLSCVALSARNKATNPFGMIITLSRIAKGGQKHAMIFPGIYFQPCMQYTVAFPWNKCAHCVIKKCYSWFSFTSVLSIFHTHLDSMRVQMLNILESRCSAHVLRF